MCATSDWIFRELFIFPHAFMSKAKIAWSVALNFETVVFFAFTFELSNLLRKRLGQKCFYGDSSNSWKPYPRCTFELLNFNATVNANTVNWGEHLSYKGLNIRGIEYDWIFTRRKRQIHSINLSSVIPSEITFHTLSGAYRISPFKSVYVFLRLISVSHLPASTSVKLIDKYRGF